MRTTHASRLAAGLTAAVLAAPTLALHEDDPKVLDWKPGEQGAGYRAGAWGRGDVAAVGLAQEFEAQGIALLSWITPGEMGAVNGNDCWGYVSGSGREYALFGSTTGTHVVEITVPSDPVIVGFIDGPDSLWRDIKVYGTRAYAVSEGGGGIQVIDLANVDAGQVTLANTVTSGGTSATHNVAIDTVSGYLYRCGGGDNGLRIYSLANPNSPSHVGSWPDRYVHDVHVRTFSSGPYAGRQIAFCSSGFNGGSASTGISIVDVTSKQNPVHRGQVTWPGAAYSHQCWLSEDGLTLFVNDELDEKGSSPTSTYVIDVSDIDNPVYQGKFENGSHAIGHNLYVKGDLVYEANYRSGLRVFDASSPLDATEIAFFDTDPDADAATFNGMWSNYPFFSGGKVICSDMARGLFVLWVGQPAVDFSFVGGAPAAIDPDGQTLALTLTELAPGDYAVGTAQLHYDAGAGLVSVPLDDLGGGAFEAALPAVPCGAQVSFYVSAESADGTTWINPPSGAAHTAVATPSLATVFTDDFDSDQGWTVGVPEDTATDGLWVRDVPIGTGAQPALDHAGAPVGFCFFTGQTPGGGLPFAGDVDGGKTTLVSPLFDLSQSVSPRITYWRWFSNAYGLNPGEGTLRVSLSGDDGASWTAVDTAGFGGVEDGWHHVEIDVASIMTPTATMRLKFAAHDSGPPTAVEAAIDDFRILTTGCADCDGSATSDDLDIASGAVTDFDADGVPDACQPLAADADALSVGAGGGVAFQLNGGASRAGELYLLLGSLGGTAPGFDLGAVHVPLVQDTYFTYTLTHAGAPPLVNSFGVLDGAGAAAAEFQLAPGYTALIGLQAHHAWIALDAATLAATLASNALPLAFDA